MAIGALFPGQGSQHIGMGQFLFDNFKEASQTYEEASDTLSLDFKKLCFTGDEKELALTFNTQPALLTTSIATFRVLQETQEVSFQAGAGHSVGEYAAMVAAGALPFSEGLRLVRLRGQLMQESVPVGKGGMLAVIGLNEEQVDRLCEWAQSESGLSPLEPANYNSPEQIVVSGSQELIAWTRENFSPDKVGSDKPKFRLIPLKVSAPFHCSMMSEAQEGMKKALDESSFQNAQWDIAQNFTGQLHSSAEELRKNLVQQISGAVKWTHCIDTLRKQGIETMIEIGPGKVLTGLSKKIDSSIQSFNLNSLEDLKTLESFLESQK